MLLSVLLSGVNTIVRAIPAKKHLDGELRVDSNMCLHERLESTFFVPNVFCFAQRQVFMGTCSDLCQANVESLGETSAVSPEMDVAPPHVLFKRLLSDSMSHCVT